MSDFSRLLEEDRRLVILRLLAEAPDYRGNSYLLQSALDGFGHAVGLDRLVQDLAWLDEQGLVRIESVGAVTIATLTARGNDVATGRSRVPGVKRPAPEA